MSTLYFRRVDDWECLVLEAKPSQRIWRLTDSRSNTVEADPMGLEPYPTHVIATRDFPPTEHSLGGQIHEVFWIKDPLTAYAGTVLEVVPVNGGTAVLIPIRYAEPHEDPLGQLRVAAV